MDKTFVLEIGAMLEMHGATGKAMLQEEVRRLKRSQGNPRIDEDPTEAAAGPDLPASTSASDPMCCGCKKYLAYDTPMSVFLRGLTAYLAERDEWIRETHNLYRAQSEKLNKRKRG